MDLFDNSDDAMPAEGVDVKQGSIFPIQEDLVCFNIDLVSSRKNPNTHLSAYVYDQRARLVEVVDGFRNIEGNAESGDKSFQLLPHIKTSMRSFQFKKMAVNRATSCFMVFLGGEIRTLHPIEKIVISCVRAKDDDERHFIVGENCIELFQCVGHINADKVAFVPLMLYRDGFDGDTPRWNANICFEFYNKNNVHKRDELVRDFALHNVPSYEKFRPHVFQTVKGICTALASSSMQRLKRRFLRRNEGLLPDEFLEAVMRIVLLNFPQLADLGEASFLVMLIRELFHQIDINGDGYADWNEFTSFVIQSNAGQAYDSGGSSSQYNVGDYDIMYQESPILRDQALLSHRMVMVLKYFPSIRRLFVVEEDTPEIIVLDESFQPKARFDPKKLSQSIGYRSTGSIHSVPSGFALTLDVESSASNLVGGNRPQSMCAYDIIYIRSRDSVVYCSADHSIAFVKEKLNQYSLQARIYHPVLQVKLCWAEKSKVLCSVGVDQSVYGWDIDTLKNTFHIQRHADIMTDFIYIDHMDMFATAGMDKRVCLWRADTRRVYAMFSGHTRGVNALSYAGKYLLSSGFETEARLWNTSTRTQAGILKGHRRPISTSKIMCQWAREEREYRALTVDEGGEFRLWTLDHQANTRSDEFVTLQIFEMENARQPLNKFKFIITPYDEKHSAAYYSNLFACSTKLMHFLPCQKVKDFIPASCVCINDHASTIVTAIGKHLLKYDLTSGQCVHMETDFTPKAAMTAVCSDGFRCRRLFFGCSNGDLLIMAFMSNMIIGKMNLGEKDISSVVIRRESRRTVIYTGSADGILTIVEESGGKMRLLTMQDECFGKELGISKMIGVHALKALVVQSTGRSWGVWDDLILKRLLLIVESEQIFAVELLATAKEGTDALSRENMMSSKPMLTAKLCTIAVALGTHVKIYTVGLRDFHGVWTHTLSFNTKSHITNLTLLKAPQFGCANYSVKPSDQNNILGTQLIATDASGYITAWDANEIGKVRMLVLQKYI
jgi:WD40 repeat protein